MGSMVAKDAPHVVESSLSEEDLVLIRKEYSLLDAVKLEFSGPSDRVTWVALNKEAFKVTLRLFLPDIMAELLWWYQIDTAGSECMAIDHGILQPFAIVWRSASS